MRLHSLTGYDRHGAVADIETTLGEARLGTRDVVLAALGFNAPAWVIASSMSFLYVIAGRAAPLTILIAYLFPMLVLALSLVRLVREAPSAAGIFTFAERFLHPVLGSVLGCAYVVACVTIAAMTAVIGAEYIQALLPGLAGSLAAKLIGTALLAIFAAIGCRGIEITARIAGIFLVFEIIVVVGLSLCGVFAPQVHDLSLASLYAPTAAGGWTAIGQGVLYGVWMMANFDSAINFIEEAKVPVRTTQRAMLIVLTTALVIYSLAAIGWQYAVPMETLAAIAETGNGGAIAAVADVYLPGWLSWIAIFVVITSGAAGLQISMNSGARTLYRMSREGYLPASLGRVNASRVPATAIGAITSAGIVLIWWKPLAHLDWYYDVGTITLVFAYVAALLAAVRLLWSRHPAGVAAAASLPPLLAVAMLTYIGYTAGASPVDRADRYNAWICGLVVLAFGGLVASFGRRGFRATDQHEAPPATGAVSTVEIAT
jgi:amino acid transporter